jgi:hypothetical protein
MSHEMEVEDYLVIMRRENAVLRRAANPDLREQISNLTLALDEALAMARKYRGGNQEGEEL